MRHIPCTILLLWLLVSQASLAAAPLPTDADPAPLGGENGDPTLNEDLVRLRFQFMAAPFAPVYDADVAAYLRRYLTYGRADTERMLGQGQLFFPIFEHYLEMNGLPTELKYLPMVESGMVPVATSVSGAAGLWQLMPRTAQSLGLAQNSYIDERRDPYRSTEAAVKYLKKLHDRFGKWELALAAYNCGPTRLSRVIRTAGSNDFWKIKKYLPRETQRYVCRFLAACYIGAYYQQHDLQPKAPDAMLLQGMAARIYHPISLPEIARTTGLEVATLRHLNPAFRRNYLPARKEGVFLVLPRSAWHDYLQARSATTSDHSAAVRP